MEKPAKWNRNGTFVVDKGREVVGDLVLRGRRTLLTLYAKDQIDLFHLPTDCIRGSMFDLTKVSLLHCLDMGVATSSSNTGDKHASVNVIPQFVVYGQEHIVPKDKVVGAIEFFADDAISLCYDFDAFGHTLDASPFIEAIVRDREERFGRKIEIGEDASVAYFAGKLEIFSTNTVLGVFSASHRPTWNMGGPDGVSIKNRVAFKLSFSDNVNFDTAFAKALTAVRYVGFLIGRPQKLSSVKIWLGSDPETPRALDLYWPLHPRLKREGNDRQPSPTDVLISPIFNAESFGPVTQRWFEREAGWEIARLRFFDSFSDQLSYDIDRLIRSANMFDILPPEAVPSDAPVAAELSSAKQEARKIFANLPVSPERDSVLGALGRIGKSSLKRKVRHRANMLLDAAGDRFPDLLNVTDEAINARNYFVHGGDARFDYAKHLNVLWFFADTLEFIFGGSDLVEAGWDLKGWLKTASSLSHPFSRYRFAYGEYLQKFHEALASSKVAGA